MNPAETPLRREVRVANGVPASLPVSDPPRVPDHELMRPIAAGSYGDVLGLFFY